MGLRWGFWRHPNLRAFLGVSADDREAILDDLSDYLWKAIGGA